VNKCPDETIAEILISNMAICDHIDISDVLYMISLHLKSKRRGINGERRN